METIVEKPLFQKNLVITYNDSILTNILNVIAKIKIQTVTLKRWIHHLINCVKNGFRKLFLSTGDTDMLISLMSVLPNILENFQFGITRILKSE